MDKTPLLHEHTEQLGIKEMAKEWPLGHRDVLEEQLLVKEERGIAGILGGSGEKGAETHPMGSEGEGARGGG